MTTVKHFQFGTLIETGAVIRNVPAAGSRIPGWVQDEAQGTLCRDLSEDEIVYGLGESVRGMNKRGWIYESNNSDDPNHTEDKHSLYASQNFFLIFSRQHSYGMFVDTPGKVSFDIGYSKMDQMKISLDDFAANVYTIEGENPTEVIRSFHDLIGKSYIPPKWAFGYGQSRWSYMNEQEVLEVVRSYRDAGIPIDSVYLDIDYMDHYKDFTINNEAFPDFDRFTRQMKEQGIHLVPIIDAGVKIEKGYDVYEEGVEKQYFCQKENGENLVAAVWPGRVHFPDFLDEKTREWFGGKYQWLISQGVDGFWNDMNEPAIFYTEDHLKEVFRKIDLYRDQNLDIRSFFAFKELVDKIDNNPEDYRRFYHHYHGQLVRHDKVHNLYGYYMTMAAGEAFRRYSPDKRILMFSRASYIGMHRYGGVWTGDNKSWWSHLLLSFQQMPGLNMCGFLYSGSDIGGFGADCTEDLMLRWLEMAIMTPLYRNHSAEGTRRQELYRFEHIDWFRNLVNLRYALIPYIYSEFMKAVLSGGMYMMPLSFVYPEDERADRVEDQLIVGESIMLAPVYLQNAVGRSVYLPEDMKLIRFRSCEDYEEEILTAGDHYIPVALNETILFLRKGHVLPMAQPAQDVEQIDYSKLFYLTYEAEPEDYELYNDDGISTVS